MLYRGRVLENYELGYRENNNNSYAFWHFRPLVNVLLNAKIKEFSFKDPSMDKKLSTNTSMKEVKPVVLEKSEFEYRDLN